jgi:glutaconate CoA-transferase subunit B
MDLEPNDLLLFARVVDEGSFSRAAERVGLPKSTVSRRVASLEAQLGERLLLRTTRKLTVTDFGHSVLEHAHQVLAEVDAAAALAQQRHAPNLTMVIEGGIIGPRLKTGRLPISTNEMRAAYRATMLPGISDTFLFAQRGFLDYGFMGGAQIDQYGNINTTVIGPDYAHPKVRLPGTGGANDIASLCREVIILTAHEKRRFIAKVDFVTSPAWLGGHAARERAGLLFGGVSRVVTTLGVLGFDEETRRMRIEALHPGVTRDAIRASTGFELLDAKEITTTEPPSDDELRMLRALDPDRRFLG